MVTTGAPAVILEGIQRENTGGTLQFAVSQSGTLIYQAGEIGGGERVVWVGRDGRPTPVDSAWKIAYSDGVALAPDESRLVVTAVANDGIHLFVKALPTGAPTRLTFDGTTNDRPGWSPDSRRISFLSTRPDGRQAWAQVADGSNPPDLLTSYRGDWTKWNGPPMADGSWDAPREAVARPESCWSRRSAPTPHPACWWRATSMPTRRWCPPMASGWPTPRTSREHRRSMSVPSPR